MNKNIKERKRTVQDDYTHDMTNNIYMYYLPILSNTAMLRFRG
jgi:hypothetical protein